MIFYCCSTVRICKSLKIQCSKCPFLYILCISCICHSICLCHPLCCQHIVNCLMRTISDCKIIISCIQDPISFCTCCIFTCAVPACHILRICRNFHSHRFSRLQHICFLIIQKLYRRFFYCMFFIIFRIWKRRIQLYYIFSCHISSIFYRYFSCHCLIFQIYIQTVQGLRKSSIRQPVTKRIRNFIFIVPCFSVGTSCLIRSISLSQDRIRISCLVIFISCINSFCLYNFRIDGICRICICPLIISIVLSCR